MIRLINTGLLFLLFLASTFGKDATTVVVDSIKNRLDQGIYKDNEDKVFLFTELAYYLTNSDLEQALGFADSAFILAEKIGYEKGLGDAAMRYGTIYLYLGAFEKAETNLKKAAEIRGRIGSVKSVASVHNTWGNLKKRMEDFTDAKQQYIKALNLYKSTQGLNGISMVYNNIGLAERYLRNYKSAIAYFDSSEQIRKEIGPNERLADIYINKGNTFSDMAYFDEAFEYMDKAFAIYESEKDETGIFATYLNKATIYIKDNKLLEAAGFLECAQALESKLSNFDLFKLYLANGTLKEKEGSYSEALGFYNKSLDQISAKDQAIEVANVHYNIGKIKMLQNEYQKAEQELKKSLDLIKDKSASVLSYNVLQKLSEISFKLGNLRKAYDLRVASDSIWVRLNKSEVEALRHESELKEERSTNMVLQARNDRQRIENSRLRIIIMAGLGILLLIAISIMLFVSNQNQKQQYLNKEREVDQLISNIELNKADERIKSEERIRTQIAQDLHDGLGGLLAAVKMNFVALEDKVVGLIAENQKQYHDATNNLDKAMEEVRTMSRGMKSGKNNYFSFEKELEDLVNSISNFTSVSVELKIFNWKDDDSVQSLSIYRIIQEAVGNTLKHAQASKLSINVNRFKKILNLLIEDNGVGFDLDKVKNTEGIGLKGIEGRVEELNGELNIDTKPGKGTTIIIDIPIEENISIL